MAGELKVDVREKLVKQAISHFCYGVSHDIFSEPVATYAKLAAEALETRIPKKPIERFMLSYDIDAGVCPLCNVGVHEEMNFCSYCGQAIDWEVSE